MKLFAGLALGVAGYVAWKLSEPAPGESPVISSRIERLKREWQKATDEGRVAGEAKRRAMEVEFESVFQK
jgi:hypothetical protein